MTEADEQRKREQARVMELLAAEPFDPALYVQEMWAMSHADDQRIAMRATTRYDTVAEALAFLRREWR